MKELEYKEGILFVGGQVATDKAKDIIFALSASTGSEIKETCDLVNQLLQSFDTFMEKVQEMLQALKEIFKDVSQDICEPCINRGTRHGSSIRTGKRLQAKANIKWREKYRPP